MQAVLIAILTVAVSALIGLGLLQWRRRRLLSRLALAHGMRFSVADPFAIPQRYAGCEWMRSGHSAYAENVIFGRLGGWLLRAFDYHFEAGHGPQRLTHRVSVVLAETPMTWRPVVVWRGDEVAAPGVLSGTVMADSDWLAVGDLAQAKTLSRCWPEAGSEAVSIETWEATVVFVAPGRMTEAEFGSQLTAVVDCLNALQRPREEED